MSVTFDFDKIGSACIFRKMAAEKLKKSFRPDIAYTRVWTLECESTRLQTDQTNLA
ncbi:hypothetical Protein YC6258_05477 [Gynuella sunshinyii YC6258]|uniref:Uncharacterized protein n=1 Tax=Gynuella sunshinyii YC6258 TaxID=1445510 RepID=A0A0C5VDV6_9GAMM|nr:hypothetical Protein YC6258_05477 [Gynuella sunshinyii YC6258]